MLFMFCFITSRHENVCPAFIAIDGCSVPFIMGGVVVIYKGQELKFGNKPPANPIAIGLGVAKA
jgi:hypothetical protein